MNKKVTLALTIITTLGSISCGKKEAGSSTPAISNFSDQMGISSPVTLDDLNHQQELDLFMLHPKAMCKQYHEDWAQQQAIAKEQAGEDVQKRANSCDALIDKYKIFIKVAPDLNCNIEDANFAELEANCIKLKNDLKQPERNDTTNL